MRDQNKTASLTIKLQPVRLEEFRIASMLRGTTMSSLITELMATVVKEEKASFPDAFKRRTDCNKPERLIGMINPLNNN